MRAGILRQNFGKFGQIVLQLFGKHIGRIDDEHAAAVHTEAVAARRMDMELGVQIIVGSDFFEFVRQFASLTGGNITYMDAVENKIVAGRSLRTQDYKDFASVIILDESRKTDLHGKRNAGIVD